MWPLSHGHKVRIQGREVVVHNFRQFLVLYITKVRLKITHHQHNLGKAGEPDLDDIFHELCERCEDFGCREAEFFCDEEIDESLKKWLLGWLAEKHHFRGSMQVARIDKVDDVLSLLFSQREDDRKQGLEMLDRMGQYLLQHLKKHAKKTKAKSRTKEQLLKHFA
jgi:hypothetical protein